MHGLHYTGESQRGQLHLRRTPISDQLRTEFCFSFVSLGLFFQSFLLSGSDGVLSFKVATIAITKKECYLMRKILSVLMLFIVILCFGTAASAAVPTLRVAYTITTNDEPFMAADGFE